MWGIAVVLGASLAPYNYIDELKKAHEDTGLDSLAGAVWEGAFVLHVVV